METYAETITRELATRCDLQVLALPGQANGKPPRLTTLARFMLTAARVLFSCKVDVIHLGDLVLWPLAVVARLGRSASGIAITAYGLDVIYGRRKGVLPWVYARYLSMGVRLVGQSVQILAISGATATLCREAGFEHVAVVPLGVDAPASLPAADHTATPFILFVGRLVKRKGAGWFAQQVLPLLPEPVRFIAVGKNWDETELAALRQSRRIEYREFVSREELAILRRTAIAVVMPNVPTGGNDMEGFGLTAVEAAADGGVLLASNIEGIVDAVLDGTTGFLLQAQAPQQWADKITEVTNWSAPQRELFIQQARRAIAEQFSWSVVAQRTLALYEARQ